MLNGKSTMLNACQNLSNQPSFHTVRFDDKKRLFQNRHSSIFSYLILSYPLKNVKIENHNIHFHKIKLKIAATQQVSHSYFTLMTKGKAHHL